MSLTFSYFPVSSVFFVVTKYRASQVYICVETIVPLSPVFSLNLLFLDQSSFARGIAMISLTWREKKSLL